MPEQFILYFSSLLIVCHHCLLHRVSPKAVVHSSNPVTLLKHDNNKYILYKVNIYCSVTGSWQLDSDLVSKVQGIVPGPHSSALILSSVFTQYNGFLFF